MKSIGLRETLLDDLYITKTTHSPLLTPHHHPVTPQQQPQHYSNDNLNIKKEEVMHHN